MKIHYFLMLSLISATAFSQESAKEEKNPLQKPASELKLNNILKTEKEFSIDPKAYLRTIGTGSVGTGSAISAGAATVVLKGGVTNKLFTGLGVSGTALVALGQKSFITGKDAMTERKLIISQLEEEAILANRHPDVALSQPGGYIEAIKYFEFSKEKIGNKSFYNGEKLNERLATEFVSSIILKLIDLKENRDGFMTIGNEKLPGFFKTKISKADLKELLGINFNEANVEILKKELLPIFEISVIEEEEEKVQKDEFDFKVVDDKRFEGKEFLHEKVKKAVEQNKRILDGLDKAVKSY